MSCKVLLWLLFPRSTFSFANITVLVHFCWSGLLKILRRFCSVFVCGHSQLILLLLLRACTRRRFPFHLLCETSTRHLDSYPPGDTWYGVIWRVLEFNVLAYNRFLVMMSCPGVLQSQFSRSTRSALQISMYTPLPFYILFFERKGTPFVYLLFEQ